MRIIYTYNHSFGDFILKQLKNLNSNFLYSINDTISVLSTTYNFENFYKKLMDGKIIFFHHIQSVDLEIKLTNNYIEEIKSVIIDNLNNFFDNKKSYSIHIRTINNNYNKIDIIKSLEELITLKKDNLNPEQVISILIHNDICYIGFSETRFNLSKWKGGEVRYNYQNCISRAEFKLMELFDIFKINLDNFKTALDLGCAPGGWSKVLLDKGLKVVGIDPADVDEKIKNNKNFTHYKKLSEDFKKTNKDNYDIIVNDMKLDYKTSIKITKSFLKNLSKNGIVIMTIKLFKNDNIIEVINTIKDNFQNILLIRQLYHNRSEFTVIIK